MLGWEDIDPPDETALKAILYDMPFGVKIVVLCILHLRKEVNGSWAEEII